MRQVSHRAREELRGIHRGAKRMGYAMRGPHALPGIVFA